MRLCGSLAWALLLETAISQNLAHEAICMRSLQNVTSTQWLIKAVQFLVWLVLQWTWKNLCLADNSRTCTAFISVIADVTIV